jgi:hypothetical protein
MRLNRLTSAPGQFQAIRPGSAEERGPAPESSKYSSFAQVEKQMAKLTIAIMSNQVGTLSIDSLQQLIHVQSQIPGRKTILYFSSGLIVPPEQPERFRAMISASNRANISFYAVDPSGLDTQSRVRVANLTTGLLTDDGEGGPAVQPTDYQENLRALAEDTGGFLIANSNDTRVPLRRVMEEVRAHYEATYAPTSSNYDGHFPKIEVRAQRPGLRLHSRKGYFALPMLDGEPVAPFEMAALAVLDKRPLPHDFDFHAAVLAFPAAGGETECRAVFSLPSQALHFTSAANLFHIRIAFVALIKDSQEQVVSKISRDVLFKAPASRRAEFERGQLSVTLPVHLPPGPYHMEAVAQDKNGGSAAARRIALVVPASRWMSDLVLVRSIQPSGESRDMIDPLEFSGGKITPEVSSLISSSSGAARGVYFTLYPQPGTVPDVRVAVSRDGRLVASAQLGLPLAGADGSVRIFAEIPFATLDPGVYDVMASASGAGETLRRSAVLELR